MSAWAILAITMAIQAMVSAAALAGPVLASDIAGSMGVAVELLGIYVAIIYAAAALTSLVSGDMVHRHGPIRVSQIALFLAAAGLLLLLAAKTLAAIAGAVLIGLGYGVVTPASSHLLAHNTPRERMGLVFSIKQTGVPLGGILAALVLPPMAIAFGWRTSLGVFVLACLLVALVSETCRGSLDADRQVVQGRPNMIGALRGLWSHPSMRGLAMTSFAFAAIQLILTGYLVTFLVEARGLSLAAAGGILALAQASGVGGRLLWGWFADRFLSARQVLGLLAGLSTTCATIFALAGQAAPIMVVTTVSMVFGAAAIGWNGVFLAEIARIASKSEAAGATGAALFMTYAGVVAGPPAFAFLLSHAGYATAFGGAATVMGIMTVFLLGRGSGKKVEKGEIS